MLTFLTASSTVHSSDTHSFWPSSFLTCSTSKILVCGYSLFKSELWYQVLRLCLQL